MKAFTRLLPASLIVACLTSPATFAASFNCSKARTLVETAVCTTPSLSAKDDRLDERYQPLKDRKIFRELEKQWLREVRNRCESAACLEEAYDQQIARLTPASPPAEIPSLAPLPEKQIYRRIEESPWQRFALAAIPDVNARSFVQVVDVATLDGVLNVVIFVGRSPDISPRNPAGVAGRRYFGSLYEYSDARPGLQPIVRDIRFSGWNKTGANDQGERYAGIIDGVFYYRQRLEGDAEQSMAYTLGSGVAPQPSTRLYAAQPSSMRFAKAQITQDLNVNNTGLLLHYPYTYDGNSYDRVMDPNDNGWSLVNPVWNETRPVLYFDNNGDFACVWRVDLQHKTLEKIVPEHDAISAYPVDALGREAIVYIEKDQLMFAISPDE